MKDKLWQQMADLTMGKCRKTCHLLGSCCSKDYCELADEFAKKQGVALERVGKEVPFLRESGVCVVPPHLRPICTVHQCKISGLGFDPKDPDWTKQYFKLREKLDGDLGETM